MSLRFMSLRSEVTLFKEDYHPDGMIQCGTESNLNIGGISPFDLSTETYSTYPFPLQEGRKLAPAAHRMAQGIHPACLDYYLTTLEAIAWRMPACQRFYLADVKRQT